MRYVIADGEQQKYPRNRELIEAGISFWSPEHFAILDSLKHVPLRVRYMSDLHLEFGDFILPDDKDIDLLILAGDIVSGKNGWKKLIGLIKGCDVPVIFVPGNHEFYRTSIIRFNDKMENEASIECPFMFYGNAGDVLDYGSVRFICGTAWTDMGLLGTRALSAIHAQVGMNDYKHIRTGFTSWRRLRADDVLTWNGLFRMIVASQAAYSERDVCVVTHHPLVASAIDETHAGDPLSPAYASNWLNFLCGHYKIKWHIHGHVHSARDYLDGPIRVMSNCRGYYPSHLTPGFDSNKLVILGDSHET